MNPTEIATCGLVFWHFAMVMMLGGLRVSLVLSRKKPPNDFSPDGKDVSAFSARLCRAHANSYETVPFLLALLMLSLYKSGGEWTNALALVLLGARMLQSVTHIYSTNNVAVNIRFGFFLVQVLIALYWVFAFVTA